MLGVAGEKAAQNAKGPGSFAVAIIDALADLDGKTIVERARVT
jgi:hydroxyethylthiazole kinase